MYLATLCRNGPNSLVALLAIKNGNDDERIPWTKAIIDDMRSLQSFWSPKLDELGDPFVHADSWCKFITTYPFQWKQYVSISGTCVSQFDTLSNSGEHGDNTFTCTQCPCNPWFNSRMALLAHQRKMHDFEHNIDRYIDGSGCCPVCDEQFPTRIQVVRHVSQTVSN